MMRITALLAVTVLPLAASGCSDIRSVLGVDKSAPDEFAVVSRQPLSLPPDYNLRPPREGGDYKGQQDIRARARGVVIGNTNPAAEDPYANDPTKSPGESALLQEAGAVYIDPEIRRRLKQETEQKAEEDDDFIQKMIFWRRGEPADIVDPNQEDRRLREARALGTPAGRPTDPANGAAGTNPSGYAPPPRQPSPYGESPVPSSSPYAAPPPQQPSPYAARPAGNRVDPYTGNPIGDGATAYGTTPSAAGRIDPYTGDPVGGQAGDGAPDPYAGQPAGNGAVDLVTGAPVNSSGGDSQGGTVPGSGAVDPYTGNPAAPAGGGFVATPAPGAAVDPYTGTAAGDGSAAIGTPAPDASIDPYTGQPLLPGAIDPYTGDRISGTGAPSQAQ